MHDTKVRKNPWYRDSGVSGLPTAYQARQEFVQHAEAEFQDQIHNPMLKGRELRMDETNTFRLRSVSFLRKEENFEQPGVYYFAGRSTGLVSSALGFVFDPAMDFIGVSEHPVEVGDEIWQFPGIEAAIIVRQEPQGICIISSARVG